MVGRALPQRRLDGRERDPVQDELDRGDPPVPDRDELDADDGTGGGVSDEVVHDAGALAGDEDLADVVADQNGQEATASMYARATVSGLVLLRIIRASSRWFRPC